MLSDLETFGHTLRRVASATLAIGLIAGCSLTARGPGTPGKPANPVGAAPAPPLEPVASVLAYADRTRALQGTELAQEVTRLNDAPAPADQLRLALALSQTHQPQDLARAQDLLQRVLANAGDEARPLQPLARLLAVRFAEQKRVEDLLDRQNAQLRDLQRRLDQTQDKLEALKQIERSLNNRPPAAVPPASPPSGQARPPHS